MGLDGDSPIMQLLALVLGPAGVCWATIKVTLNGARQDIRDTKVTCERMDAKLNAHGERITRVETRLDGSDQRIKDLEEAA